jgi:hypothetical protein
MTPAPAETRDPRAARPAPRAEEPLEWGFNPWRERVGASALAGVGAFGLCLGVLSLDLALLPSAGLCLAVVSALAPVLAPARCRVDRDGVSRLGPFGWARREWAAIRRGVTGDAGLLVSPFARPHWLDVHRALFLPFPASQRLPLAEETARRLALHGL